MSPEERFARALVELEYELDWTRLGELYCHEGGASFFAAEDVASLREAGLLFASDLGEALAPLPSGASLYVGAALFELAPALFESLVLGRRVHLVNLPGPESVEINRALAAVERPLATALPRVECGDLGHILGLGRVNHLWMTSVLSDPETFPALSAELYGRNPEAFREEELEGDRRRARELTSGLVARLETPCVVVTSDEEIPALERACAQRGLNFDVPPTGRVSAIVGDVIRFCSVNPRPVP